MTQETIISIFLGVGLAASVGFRVFLPLFALSLAAFFDIVPLNAQWEWVGSLPALIALGVAMLVEILGYYIPWIDNLLDTIAIPLAAIAGTAVVVSTAADLNPIVTWSLAIIAGGGTASAIKGTAAGTRMTSSISTAGLANPIVTTVETLVSFIMTLAALFLPVLAIILVVILLVITYRIYRKIRPKRH